jgi:hypothetical protein
MGSLADNEIKLLEEKNSGLIRKELKKPEILF